MDQRISIIAALGKNTRAIGKNSKLLWHIPNDLVRFREITSRVVGTPIIMGRKTFDSLPQPLHSRINIVITRTCRRKLCIVAQSLEEAFEIGKKSGTPEIFVIGGGEIYHQALSYVNKLYLTLIEDNREGDVFFPEYCEFTDVIFEETHTYKDITYTFLELVRPLT